MKSSVKSDRYFVYLHEGYVDSFCRGFLPLARPVELNDPFEFLLPNKEYRNLKDWSNDVRTAKVFRQAYENMFPQNQGHCSVDDFLDRMVEAPAEITHGFIREYQNNVAAVFKHEASRNFAILCCTKNENCALMWAHYTRKHRGFMVELNRNQSPFSNIVQEDLLLEVEYDKPRMPFELMDFNNMEVLVRNVARRKQEVWKYENEVRFLFGIETCKKNGSIVEEGDASQPGARLLLSVPPKSLNGVVFGLAMNSDLKVKIKEAMTSRTWGDFYIKQSAPSDSKFEFTYE